MASIVAHSDAIAELREAIRFYEEKSLGLGRRFFEEVNEFIGRIVANPTRYSERIAGVHRANLLRFPFHIHYLLKDEMIAVVAIAHNKRRPFYWKSRLAGVDFSATWPPISRES